MFMARFISMAGLSGKGRSSEPPVANGSAGTAGAVQPAPERGLKISEDRLRALLSASPDAVVVVGRDGRIEEINPAGEQLFGGEPAVGVAGRKLIEFVGVEHRVGYEVCVEALWRGENGYAEFESAGMQKTRRWVEMHAAPLRNDAGRVIAFLGILRDNTARRELDKQFIQAQKMEVVGQLAGGVAHDFNNILGIVMGYTEILMDSMTKGTPAYDQAQTIFHTAERAASLTRQLLIFSSKQTPRPQAVDLSEVIANIDRMLRRLIGENIKLSTLPEPEMDLVEADPCQIEQVIMNLTVNARDAMPTGGDITISSSMLQVVPGEEASMGLKPGRYAVISVADNGAGMSEEVKERIFEAFFTTKPLGKGTGLGLATCMSIVQQWNGQIFVDSTLGKGTTFRVFLPCLAGAVRVERAVASHAGEPTRGVETVLLVEDDPGLLQLTASVLERQGYHVLRATNGREGLSIVHEQEAKSVDVVVTDMVMPEMGGRMMADWLHALNPSLKILFTSGYTDLGSGGVIEAGLDFIHKPYTPTAMLRKIREILDRPEDAPAPALAAVLDAA
jgi:PAS domain S-box-containing protein